MTILIFIAIVAALAIGAALVFELRAISKVHQARWDWDRFRLHVNYIGRQRKDATSERVLDRLLQQPHKLDDALLEPFQRPRA